MPSIHGYPSVATVSNLLCSGGSLLSVLRFSPDSDGCPRNTIDQIRKAKKAAKREKAGWTRNGGD